MAKRTIFRRLAVPTLLFALFVALTLASSDILPGLGEQAVSQTRAVAGYVLRIGIWLTAAYLLNRLIVVIFWDTVVARALGGPVPRLLKDVVAAVIFMTAVSGIISQVFDKDVTAIWATSGVVGVVIGFALRSLILDVFSGLAVNVDRPYRIGDWIKVHDRRPDTHIIGCVQEINWRTTRLRTTANNLVVVPNSVMGMHIVTNFMRPDPKSRLQLVFTLGFSVPSERAIRVLEAAIRATMGASEVLEEPRPKVRIHGVSKLGVEYRIRYWVVPRDLSPSRSRHVVITSVLHHLKQAGLTLAYPKRDVFTAPMPPRQLDGMSTGDVRDLLGRIDIFAHLGAEELESLAAGVARRAFDEGQALIRAGEQGDSMFVLVEGLVYVFADVKGDGGSTRVAQILPGQFFGEMSLLTGEPRSATVVAATDAVAYEITKDHMGELLRRRPEMARTISDIVAERRLRNEQASETDDTTETEERRVTVAQQILGKMRAFFRGAFVDD